MLLSAVSVLVVAQSSSEVPEGLMNNPVYPQAVCDLLYLLYDYMQHNGEWFNLKFTTMFTTPCQWNVILNHVSPIHILPPYDIFIHFYTVLLYKLGSCKLCFPFRTIERIFISSFPVPRAYYVPCLDVAI